MPIKPRYLWLAVLLLGLSFDILFWKKSPGISFPIFIFLCLLAGFSIIAGAGLRPARASLLLVPPIIFTAIMFAVRLEPMTAFLTAAMTLFLMAILALTYLGGNWPWYSLPDYVVRFALLAYSMLARGGMYIFETFRHQSREDAVSRMRSIWPVLRGILIALPILIILTALLASADLVFSQRLGDIADIFKLDKVPEYILRGVIILSVAYLLAGAVLHAAIKSRDGSHVLGDKPVRQFLGFTEAVIVMGGVVALFAVFVAIQFQYFFGGEKNINLDGLTYAEYARRGFGELLAVAVFSLLLLIVLSLFSRRGNKQRRIIFSVLGAGLVVLVLVILASALQRMLLYEDAYGFSRLRTYTHVFMIWLGVLLVAVMILEILQRHRIFALAAVLASLGFVVTLSVINVDGLIAHRNIERAINGQELDIIYLESLSDDAVPTVADAFRTQTIPPPLHDDLGKVLAHYDSHRRGTDDSWQSYNLSSSRANSVLEELQPDLP